MLAILSQTASTEIREALTARGDQILCLPPHPALPRPLTSHPDLLLYFAKDAILLPKSYQSIAARELEIISKHAQRPLLPIDVSLGESYPLDVPLNAVRMKKTLIANPKTAADDILLPADEICRVKQGYTKCAILPVGENALITADAGIAKAARSAGMDVLLITPGAITLPGYDTGFIGGAASYAPYQNTKVILFCGLPDCHPQGERIKAFCRTHGKEPISLSSDPLFDIGTLFLI